TGVHGNLADVARRLREAAGGLVLAAARREQFRRLLYPGQAAAGGGGDDVEGRLLIEGVEDSQIVQDQPAGVLLVAVVAMQRPAAPLPGGNLHGETGPPQQRLRGPVRLGKEPFLRAAEKQRRTSWGAGGPGLAGGRAGPRRSLGQI